MKGYVYEPYLTAVSSPSVLLSSYASGYNLAESYAAANTMIGWMGVVVGDPKMSPYADIVHDVEIIDIRVLENASVNRSFKLEVALQNIGPGEAKGELKVMDKLGSVILANQTLTIADGSQNGSRLIVELEVNSSRKGWNKPNALDPPPIHATKTSGSLFSFSKICFFASSPITDWKSLTIFG